MSNKKICPKNLEHVMDKLENNELSFLDLSSEFEFSCVQCGKCCRNQDTIILSPFDLFHLSIATGLSVASVIEKYGTPYVGSVSHLPLVQLRCREDPYERSTTCPFLGCKEGKYYCRVHDYKPTVCRVYPLGKLSDPEKLDVKYFCQDDLTCLGAINAKKEHITQVVEDWCGGKTRVQSANRYSKIFNEFHTEFGKIMTPDMHNKLQNIGVIYDAFYKRLQFILIPDKKYDSQTSDEQFLDEFQKNCQDALDFVRMSRNVVYSDAYKTMNKIQQNS